MLRLGGPRLADQLNSTKEEARAILHEMGFTKPDPKRLLRRLIDDGALVSVGDGVYHYSDQEHI